MFFKVWLENQEDEVKAYFAKHKLDAPLSYYDYGGWQPAALGDKYSAYIQKKHNKISIDNLTAYHPDAKKITQELLNILPELANYELNFDGHEVGSLANFIGSKFDHPSEWYHGTSTWHYEQIKESGLMPRTQSGIVPSYYNISTPAGEEDSVYLSSDDGNDVRFAARSAMSKATAEGHDAKPIILKIPGDAINPSKMFPDEDSRTSSWQDSLNKIGTIRYIGMIRPHYIQPHMIWDKDWVRV